MVRHHELIERASSLRHIEDSRGETLKLIQACRETKTLAQASFDSTKREEDARHERTVTGWLAAADSKGDQEDFASLREDIPDTGQWVLSVPKIIQFLDPTQDAVPIFWIYGIPGAGNLL